MSPPQPPPARPPPSLSPSPHPPPPDLPHFLSIPWTASLLAAPHTTVLGAPPTRVPKASTEDSLFAETLRTGRTITHMLSFVVRRGGGVGDRDGDGDVDDTSEQVCTLLSLASGMNGYPGVAHGGIIATLFDEAMGVCMMRRREVAAAAAAAAAGTATGTAMEIVTAGLNVKFVRMLRTPATVVVRVWVEGRRGRKWDVRAEMEDGEGVVAKGEATWVEVRANM